MLPMIPQKPEQQTHLIKPKLRASDTDLALNPPVNTTVLYCGPRTSSTVKLE